MRLIRAVRYHLFVVLAAGCAGQGGSGGPSPEGVPLSVRVENQNDFSAEIFAYRNRQRTRLGIVESGRTLILPFTWNASDLQFIIDLIGAEGSMSALPEPERRNAFAADAAGDTVPCILTERYDVEANLMLNLTIPTGLEREPGRSRCAR